MFLTLHRLTDKDYHVYDQILGFPIIPKFTSTCSTLLYVPCKPLSDTPVFVDDSFVLAFQHDVYNRSR